MSQLADFHFIRPLILFGIPFALTVFALLRGRNSAGQWSDYLPAATVKVLQVSTGARARTWPCLALFMTCVLIIAAAGPTVSQQAVPTVSNQGALVIALDLSPSMLAEDLSPNRLERAKYKLIDILRAQADGQVALIAYSGDAHTVSPLTDDPKTIQSLLPALDPSVMPMAGSNTEAALDLSQALLRDAGLLKGDILFITDGITEAAADYVSRKLEPGNTLSILGVSGVEPAPIPKAGGGFVQSARGEIILTAVDDSLLRQLALNSNGQFARISSNDSDLDAVLTERFNKAETDAEIAGLGSWSGWVDLGHWLVLLILPLALYSFRKGLIYLLPLVIILPNDVSAESWYDSLLKTPNQRAAEHYERGEYDQAAESFERADWQAMANYRSGEFADAAQQFAQLEDQMGVEAFYNQGNALAMAGEFQAAIEAYDKVLTAAPEHADALHNKAVIEEILKQQQSQDQQSQDQQSQDQQSQDQQSQDQQSQDQQSQDQQSQDQQSQDQQSQDQQNQDQQNQDQQNQDQQNQEQQSQEQQSQDQQSQDQQSQEQQSQEQQDQEQQDQEQQVNAEANGEESDEDATAESAADISASPLSESSEQWLRTIQDDPSGLLRRKFEYQSQQRARNNVPLTPAEERY